MSERLFVWPCVCSHHKHGFLFDIIVSSVSLHVTHMPLDALSSGNSRKFFCKTPFNGSGREGNWKL